MPIRAEQTRITGMPTNAMNTRMNLPQGMMGLNYTPGAMPVRQAVPTGSNLPGMPPQPGTNTGPLPPGMGAGPDTSLGPLPNSGDVVVSPRLPMPVTPMGGTGGPPGMPPRPGTNTGPLPPEGPPPIGSESGGRRMPMPTQAPTMPAGQSWNERPQPTNGYPANQPRPTGRPMGGGMMGMARRMIGR